MKKVKYIFLKTILIYIVFVSSCQYLYSQTETEYLKFNGSVSLSSDFYNASGIPLRQQANVQRLILRTNISLFDIVQLPFELNLSNSESRFLQPFNQFGISPKIADWLTLHGGYFYSNLSDLTFGDIKIFGGGIELTPGNFRLKAFYGRSKSANEPDSSKLFGGIYEQKVYAFMIGYGNENSAYLNLNLSHTIDDSTSIKRIKFSESPTENLVTSITFGLKIIDELFISGEVAAAALTSDITSDKITQIAMPEFLFTPKISSQTDGAAKLNILIEPSNLWSLRLGARWIGPGFVTTGYTQLPNDLMEYTIDPGLRLLDNRLNIKSSLGFRTNNLRNNKISTTSRFIGLFSADYQITDEFGINIQYNNNQIKSAQYADSIKISNVLNFISFSPRLNFQGLGGANNLMLNYSYQNSEDRNPYYLNSVKNLTNTINLVHSVFFPSGLNFSTGLMYNNVVLSISEITMLSINETVGCQFFDNTLSLYGNIGYSSIKVQGENGLFLLGLRITYSFGNYGMFGLYITNNNYNSRDALTPSYSEMQGNLNYTINF